MLKNYLVIAFRNLWRNKLHSTINILGISLGISICLVVFLITNHELSFDTFRQDNDRIYRVYSEFSGSFDATNHGVSGALPSFTRDNITGIESLVAFHTYSAKVTVPYPDGKPKDKGMQKDIVISEPSFFDVFPDCQWLAGTPESSLTGPNLVVLTEEKARQYFGLADPEAALGLEVRYRDSLIVTVSGIIRPTDKNTDLDFGDFISFNTIKNTWLKNNINLEDWSSTNSSSQLFIKGVKGSTPESLLEKFSLAEEHYIAENPDLSWNLSFKLQPLSDLHFNTELGIFDNSRSAAHKSSIKGLILVAFMLLLIAAINFINLETAQSARRSREVGVRKVLGGTKKQLTLQFLGETFILTAIAIFLSVQIATFALGQFTEFIPEGVALNIFDPFTMIFLGCTLILVTILAGLYPAFVLSSFSPVRALKNWFIIGNGGNQSSLLRKGLIVFQFTFAQILIFGTFVVGRQISFMINSDMGFNSDAIVYFYSPYREAKSKNLVLEQELRKLPELEALSVHSSTPAQRGYSTSVMQYEKGDERINYNVHRKFADTNYIHLYGIELLTGRNLLPSDTVREFLINETFSKSLGFENPLDAIGQHVLFSENPIPVVGVVKDFHIQSMHNPIQPAAIANERPNFHCFSLKLNTKNQDASVFTEAMQKVENIWKGIYPEATFKYDFLDETLANFYESEQRTSKLVGTLTAIAIFISCLGLLGLISFMVVRRTKEIGIRKILGASIANIMNLLSVDFLKLVLIASLIAFPIAWFLMDRWLEDFVYRISIEWWMFIVVGLAAQIITLSTLSFKALRAAKDNPVLALRQE